MNLRLSINTDGLMTAFNAAPQTLLDHLAPAVWKGVEAIQLEARVNHHFSSKTGTLERAVSAESLSDTTARVFLDTQIPYAASIHDGSQRHWIGPVNRSALRFPAPGGAGGFWFSKGHWHPGTQPDQLIYAAAEAKRQEVHDNINGAVSTALREVGL